MNKSMILVIVTLGTMLMMFAVGCAPQQDTLEQAPLDKEADAPVDPDVDELSDMVDSPQEYDDLFENKSEVDQDLDDLDW